MTAQEIMDILKEKLGDSFDCDTTETEDRMSGYWGFDMDKVENWAAMSNSNSSLNSSTAVIVKVKGSYAQDAAALLQTGYEQMLSYSRMYNMNLQQVLQARLFVNGNCVALLVLGEQGDWENSDEDQAKFAATEAAKVDEIWGSIFGSADNIIVIPEDDGSNGFNMDDEPIIPDESEIGSEETMPENDPATSDDEKSAENEPAKENNAQKPDNSDDGSKNDSSKSDDTSENETQKELTAQDVLDSLKSALGSSYTSDATESDARMSGYWGLDMSQVESWAAETNSMSSMNMDCAVVLKVKDGYASEAAGALQKAFEQTISYARMYNMDLQRVLQARLYINGNYVALLIEGQKADDSTSVEDQAKFAAEEATKIDSAWAALFGSASNSIVIPSESENSGNDGGLIGFEDDGMLGG